MNFTNVDSDWQKIDEIIISSSKILLTTHENPDGDGLGSEVAMYHHLIEIGKDVKIINCSTTPAMFDYINIKNCIETYDESRHLDWIQDCELVVVFDVGDFSRTRVIKDVIEKFKIPVMNIDHHPHPEKHGFEYSIVDIQSAATGCMVRSYLKIARSAALNKKICDGIYTAVMTDTGCFKYSNTDTFCHSIAIECLENGVDTNYIYQKIYENSSKKRVSVLAEMISNISYELGGKFAWSFVTKETMKKHDAHKEDLEGFPDFIRSIEGVEAALMIFEIDNDLCRMNFRSKGKIVVNLIAKSFGGGGHAFASGAVLHRPIDKAKNVIVEKTKEMIKNQLDTIL
tara:strand:- start:29 stop:1054 length:1026 start_codon:yes stop_codon:yes gene_type:complete